MTEGPWELPEGWRWTSVWEVTSLIQTCGNDTAALDTSSCSTGLGRGEKLAWDSALEASERVNPSDNKKIEERVLASSVREATLTLRFE
jgi:hypothetical protein